MAIDRTRLLDAVRGLDLPADQFAVFGSGPLVVRGLREGADIDLLVTPELYARLRATPEWTARRRDDGGETLARADFDVMERLEFPGYVGDVRAMIADAERIDGVPFVRLPELRTFKAALNRPKDHVDLELIDAALARERTPGDAERERRREEATRTLAGPGTPAASSETPSWTGGGWSFLTGVCTRPRRTFAAARGTRFWWTAYLVLLVAAELNATARVRGHGSPLQFLVAPVAAGIGLLLALVAASVALAVARSVTTETSAGPATTQTAIVWGLCVVPQAVVQLVFGTGVATTVVGVVAAVAALALTALLYAEGFGVSVGRGVVGALAGILTAFAAVVLVAFVLAACGAVG
ncbi:MAG: hypothetical protein J2P24_16295 [Streptosporangiales bacterium]|nr:hypothetical protein [Streptosporangiales bacterium]MBO0891645.1 hypothetical protein [Acidothermales bacterium]